MLPSFQVQIFFHVQTNTSPFVFRYLSLKSEMLSLWCAGQKLVSMSTVNGMSFIALRPGKMMTARPDNASGDEVHQSFVSDHVTPTTDVPGPKGSRGSWAQQGLYTVLHDHERQAANKIIRTHDAVANALAVTELLSIIEPDQRGEVHAGPDDIVLQVKAFLKNYPDIYHMVHTALLSLKPKPSDN